MNTIRRERTILALILVLYFALAGLFAAITPAWQAPDEPAHYNYVRYLAENGAFPVLHPGDYPHAYLEEIKSRKFPPDLSIAPIRYEFHQPPLYYALAAPFYTLAGGNLLALRWLSVLLGAGIVLLAHAVARQIVGLRHALAAAAFVAFLPQHLTTVSQVGNDVLAELLFAAVLYHLVSRFMQSDDLRPESRESGESPDKPQKRWPAKTRSLLGLGILLGLILITKTTAYIAVPLAAGVLIWRWTRARADVRHVLVEGVAVLVPPAVIALPWYVRDIAVYGWPDFLGLIRHDQIVVGQMRAADFIAQQGWGAYWQRAILETFRSFWGQFGWMGVVMDSRIYFVLAIFSGAVLGGLAFRIANSRRRRPGGHSTAALALLIASTTLTLLVFAWYNTQFLQHQGRYLFTALIPLAIFFSLGWEEALRPRANLILAAALVLFGFGLTAWGILTGHGLPKWPLVLTALLAGVLMVAAFGPHLRVGRRRLLALLFALPLLALPLLDLYALFGAIVPQLTR